jgi:hypothetical protein
MDITENETINNQKYSIKSYKLWIYLFFIIPLLIVGLYFTVVSINKNSGIFDIRKKAAQNPITLSFAPNNVVSPPQQQFSVGILINTGDYHITAAKIVINYDPTIIEGVSFINGRFLPINLKDGRFENGKATIILGCHPSEPKIGSAIVASITFKTLSSSPTNISIAPDTQISALGYTTNVINIFPTPVFINNLIPSPTTNLSATITNTPIPTATRILTPTTHLSISPTIIIPTQPPPQQIIENSQERVPVGDTRD